MGNKKIYFCCFYLSITVFGGAQTTYTLEQCKEFTRNNNNEIVNSRLQIKEAEQTKKEAFTKYFPSVSATGSAMNASTGTMKMDMMGNTLSLMKNGVLGGVTATQPVFAGGNILNGNKLAKVGLEASKYQAKLSEEESLLLTEQYYWQIVSLQEKIKTIGYLETMLQSIRKDVDASYQAGITTLNDVLKVKLKQNELASKRLQVENGLDMSVKALCQHIGLDSDGFAIQIDSIGIEVPEKIHVNHAAVLSERTESKLLDKNVEASVLQLRIKKGEYMPRVAVGAGYMYHNLTDVNTDFGVVFATVSIPISDWWGGSHAIRKQKINKQIAINNQQNLSEQLLLQMQKTWNDLEESYKQVLLAKESVSEATENLRLNQDYFKAGTVSLTDLLDAESLLQQSYDQYTESNSDYQIKRSKYLQVTGRY